MWSSKTEIMTLEWNIGLGIRVVNKLFLLFFQVKKIKSRRKSHNYNYNSNDNNNKNDEDNNRYNNNNVYLRII